MEMLLVLHVLTAPSASSHSRSGRRRTKKSYRRSTPRAASTLPVRLLAW